jgi:hypothetical protein
MICCKILPMFCCKCCMLGKGQLPLTQKCPSGASEFLGRPVEYVDIDAIKALPFSHRGKLVAIEQEEC